ncbi:MAG: hypothetical protein HFF09_07790, partial [Oscillospiraceae bacterium]|nr:hypothetical protein [Oscillospiraceae bacterium]
MRRKVCSLLLAAAMLMSLLGTVAFAAVDGTQSGTSGTKISVDNRTGGGIQVTVTNTANNINNGDKYDVVFVAETQDMIDNSIAQNNFIADGSTDLLSAIQVQDNSVNSLDDCAYHKEVESSGSTSLTADFATVTDGNYFVLAWWQGDGEAYSCAKVTVKGNKLATPFDTTAGTLTVNGTVGTALAGQTVAGDFGGTDAYSYAVKAGETKPDWATINASTGAITGTPTSIPAATTVVEVTCGTEKKEITITWNIAKGNTTASLSATSADYGKAAEPTVTVKCSGITLVKDTDYTVSWDKAITTTADAGTYTATVTLTTAGAAKYNTPTGTLTYTINKVKHATPTATSAQASADDAEDGSITITNPVAGATYQINKDNGGWEDKTLDGDNKITALGKGSYQVRVKEDTNHTASDPLTIAVSAAGAPVAKLDDKTVTYDGNPQSVNVSVAVEGETGDQIANYDVYYTGIDGTTYAKSTTAPTNAGKYTVTVESKTGGANPSETATLTIEKKPLSLSFSGNTAGKTLADVTETLNGKVGTDDVTVNITWTEVTGTVDVPEDDPSYDPDDETTHTRPMEPKDVKLTASSSHAYTVVLSGAAAGNYTLENGNMTVPGGGGGFAPVSSNYTVNYVAGTHGSLTGSTSEKVEKGKTPASVPTPAADKGYAFVGWSMDGGKTFVNPAAQTISANTTFTAMFGHKAYVQGRPGDVFVPNGNITRAEAVRMMCNLEDDYNVNGSYASAYTDVLATDWFASAVGYGSQHNFVTGYPDGSYKPTGNITRGEFAALVARYMGVAEEQGSTGMSDVAGHWAEGYITAMVNRHLIDGYNDGTFRPDQYITRAEAVRLMNGALSRRVAEG